MPKQTETIIVRVTPEEKKLLQEYAQTHYMTLSAVFRKFCIDKIREKK